MSSLRRLSLPAALASASAVVLSLVTPATAANAAVAAPFTAPTGSLSLQVKPMDVTTSTGKHLSMELFSRRNKPVVQLSRQGRNAEEIHAWQMTVDRALRFNRDTKVGSLKATLQQTHRRFATSLTIKQTDSWTRQRCPGGGSLATAPVRVRGDVVFRTFTKGASPWGAVGSRSKRFEVKKRGWITADSDCSFGGSGGPFVGPCFDEMEWRAANFDGFSLTFEDAFSFTALDATRLRKLAGGTVLRFDALLADVPKPVLTKSDTGATLKVRTRNTARLSGSGTLASTGAGRTTQQPCDPNGTQTKTVWRGATFTNGTTPLTVHMDIGRNMRLRNGTTGRFSQTVVD